MLPKNLEELINKQEIQYKKDRLDPWVSGTYVNILIINLVMQDRKSQRTLFDTLVVQNFINMTDI